jgi:hypothetical protein
LHRCTAGCCHTFPQIWLLGVVSAVVYALLGMVNIVFLLLRLLLLLLLLLCCCCCCCCFKGALFISGAGLGGSLTRHWRADRHNFPVYNQHIQMCRTTRIMGLCPSLVVTAFSTCCLIHLHRFCHTPTSQQASMGRKNTSTANGQCLLDSPNEL